MMIGVTYEGFSPEAKCWNEGSCGSSNEPISVLDARESPSPSTSTSTLSSFFAGANPGGGGSSSTDNTSDQKWPVSALPEMGSGGSVQNPSGDCSGGRRDEWAAELQPIPVGLGSDAGSFQRLGLGLEDWESLLSESGASPATDQSLLRWISGDLEDNSLSLKQLLQRTNPNGIDEISPVGYTDHHPSIFQATAPVDNVVPISIPLAFGGSGSSIESNPLNPNILSDVDQKLPSLNPQIQTNLTHNLFLPLPDPILPPPKRHNPGFPKSAFSEPGHEGKSQFSDLGDELLPRKPHKLSDLSFATHLQQKPRMVTKQEAMAAEGGELGLVALPHHPHNQHQQVIFDQLCSAAELIMAGNVSHAQGILARLNHQLSAMANPFQRAAFYFKEALQTPLLLPNPFDPRIPSSFDGMFKMGAYKAFSEISPLIQFMNFTSNQTLLEAIGDAGRIHILDFDIGFGALWASFMQEIPRSNGGGLSPSLKITAFASPSTHHPIELGLMHENLSQFAREIGISFELEVVNFDSFEPGSFSVSPDAAIAVNLPIWSFSSHLSEIPSLLRFLKKLSPRVVVSLDRWCERTDVPFLQCLLQGLQYYEVLLDSVDAANVGPDIARKIEKFLLQPRIESMVIGRLQILGQMPHWKTHFNSAGFLPMPLSNATETQAECLVKRTPIRGFHVEKRQASLVLFWQNRELMSASAWEC